MTPEEKFEEIVGRLDKIKELDRRLEGVTETLEIVAVMQRASEERMDKFEAAQDRMQELIDLLSHLTLKHEKRLDGLEGSL